MKYVIETLEITRNYYVIEADSEKQAIEASKVGMNNYQRF